MQQPPDSYPQQQWQQQTMPPKQQWNSQQPSFSSSPTSFAILPKRPSGFRNWFRARSRKSKLGIGCGTIIAALLLCICAASAYGIANLATIPTQTPTTGNVTILNIPTENTPTDIPTLPPTPITQPLTKPTQAPTTVSKAPFHPDWIASISSKLSGMA